MILNAHYIEAVVFPYLLIEVGRELRHEDLFLMTLVAVLYIIEADGTVYHRHGVFVPVQLKEHGADTSQPYILAFGEKQLIVAESESVAVG
jgi:hypothetical protein